MMVWQRWIGNWGIFILLMGESERQLQWLLLIQLQIKCEQCNIYGGDAHECPAE